MHRQLDRIAWRLSPAEKRSVLELAIRPHLATCRGGSTPPFLWALAREPELTAQLLLDARRILERMKRTHSGKATMFFRTHAQTAPATPSTDAAVAKRLGIKYGDEDVKKARQVIAAQDTELAVLLDKHVASYLKTGKGVVRAKRRAARIRADRKSSSK